MPNEIVQFISLILWDSSLQDLFGGKEAGNERLTELIEKNNLDSIESRVDFPICINLLYN